jgi:hypothetical protein
LDVRRWAFGVLVTAAFSHSSIAGDDWGALNLSLYPNPINAFVANFIATFIDFPPAPAWQGSDPFKRKCKDSSSFESCSSCLKLEGE